jgi:protein-ribulosamine 3-kinase
MAHNQSLLNSVASGLSETLGQHTRVQWVRNLPGGDINRAALISDGSTNWFLKYHANAPDGMFAAEARALTEISKQKCIDAPSPITYGSDGDTSWLVLEYLELTSSGPASLLGEQLAALHAVTYSQYGWDRDNYIGSTPQHNTHCEQWSIFWRDHRLGPQLEMAHAAGHGSRLLSKGQRLLESVEVLLEAHQPAASLLHGDLWAGNKAFTPGGQPVIFDPASYHGDRETDIAMTELFGGFGVDFYAAYQAHSPLPEGYRLRRDLYNLYHMLNHLNLFGGAYLSRCENMIDGLLAQIR